MVAIVSALSQADTLSPPLPWNKMERVGTENVVILRGSTPWLSVVSAFHHSVRMALPKERQNFLLPKPESWFHGLLTGERGVLLGVPTADGALGGMAALTSFATHKHAYDAQSLTYPDDRGIVASRCQAYPVCVIQSVCVAHTYAGSGFSGKLIAATLRRARNARVFAQMATANWISWLRFMAQGFAIVAVWETEHRRFLLHALTARERAALRAHPRAHCRVWPKDYGHMPEMMNTVAAWIAQGNGIVFQDNLSAQASSKDEEGCGTGIELVFVPWDALKRAAE